MGHLPQKFLKLTPAVTEMPYNTFLSCNNYHTSLITVKESNRNNKAVSGYKGHEIYLQFFQIYVL